MSKFIKKQEPKPPDQNIILEYRLFINLDNKLSIKDLISILEEDIKNLKHWDLDRKNHLISHIKLENIFIKRDYDRYSNIENITLLLQHEIYPEDYNKELKNYQIRLEKYNKWLTKNQSKIDQYNLQKEKIKQQKEQKEKDKKEKDKQQQIEEAIKLLKKNKLNVDEILKGEK